MSNYFNMSLVQKELRHSSSAILKMMKEQNKDKMVVKLKNPVFVEYVYHPYRTSQHKRCGTIAKIVAVRFVKVKDRAAPQQITLACDGLRKWNIWVPSWRLTATITDLVPSKATKTKKPSVKISENKKYDVAKDMINQDLRVGDIGFHPSIGQSYAVETKNTSRQHIRWRRRTTTFRAIVEIVEIVNENKAKLRVIWEDDDTIKWLRKKYGIDATAKIRNISTHNIIKLNADVWSKLLENKLLS